MSGETTDGVVAIRAGGVRRAVEKGAAEGSSVGCDWTLYVADDLASPVWENGVELTDSSSPLQVDSLDYHTSRLFSETGRWWSATGAECVGAGLAGIYAEGDNISIPELVGQAEDLLDPPEPTTFATDPIDDGSDDRFLIVQIPTWYWIEDDYWNVIWSERVNFPATAPRVWVEAFAQSESTVWEPGDGTGRFDCPDRKVRTPGMDGDSGVCTHTYLKATTAADPTYSVQGTVWFDTWWTSNIPFQEGPLAPISRDSAVRELRVGEIQAVGR